MRPIKTTVLLLLIVLLTLLSTAALAADNEKPEAPPAEPQPASAAAVLERLEINGYFNVEGDYQLTHNGLGDRNGSFDVDVFELLLNYKGPDKFRLSAAIDWEHGTDSEFNQGELTTGWLFLEYAYRDPLKLRVGKFLTPFGVFNEIHGAKNLFLARDEPRTTLKPNKVTKNGFRFGPKWLAGAEVFGNFRLGNQSADYIIVAGNGEQTETNPYEQDNNTKKAVAARFQYMPMDNLTLGVSGYHDYLTLSTAPTGGNVTSFGAHGRFNGDRWKLLYEYAHGHRLQPGAKLAADENGHVAEVGYSVTQRLTPYVQWQAVDVKMGSVKERATSYIGGLNFQIGYHFAFKVQDAYWKASDGNKKFPASGRRYHEIQSSVFYGF